MLQAGFILLTIVMAILLFRGAAHAARHAYTDDPKQQKKFVVRTIFFLAGWLIYISIISFTGIFTIASLPPRIPLLLVLPAFLFMLFFFASGKFKAIIHATHQPGLVYMQSFRVAVELLIWGLFLNGILPQAATFDGYNFDILIGLTAPLVAYFFFNRGSMHKGVFIAWNFIGLITLGVVVFILLRHAYFPASGNALGPVILTKGLGIFPYTFLPGFLMPLAVFLHIFSILKALKIHHIGKRGG